jgi:hypothetical protein
LPYGPEDLNDEKHQSCLLQKAMKHPEESDDGQHGGIN